MIDERPEGNKDVGYYDMHAECNNCGHRDVLRIDKGRPTHQTQWWRCPICGLSTWSFDRKKLLPEEEGEG